MSGERLAYAPTARSHGCIRVASATSTPPTWWPSSGEQWRHEPTWRVLPRAALDLAITIPIQHLETKMRRTPSRLIPVTYLAIAVAGLLLAIVGGTERATVIIGLSMMLSRELSASWPGDAPHQCTRRR